MVCPTCKSQTHEIRHISTKSGEKIVECPYCPNKYVPQGLNSTIGNGSVYGGVKFAGRFRPQSAAYYHEVSRRRRDPDGRTYIDRGRKIFPS